MTTTAVRRWSFRGCARRGLVTALAAATLAGSACDSSVQPPAAGWHELAAVPQPRYYSGATAAGGKLYLVGGIVAGNFDAPERSVVSAYDPKVNTWTDLPMLPIPMIMPNVAGVGDQLFILGSLDANRSFAYDGASQSWVEKKPLPIAAGRGAAAVGVDGTTVYLAGGVVRGQSANMLNTGVRQTTAFAYDTGADAWQTLAELPVAVGYATGAIVDGLFWVMGGSTNLSRTDEVLAFDLTGGQWAEKMPLPVGLSSAAGGVVGGKIYLMGGIATSIGRINADTLAMDPKTETWTTLAAIPTPRFAMGAGVIDGEIYVPSGLASTMDAAMFGATPALEAFVP